MARSATLAACVCWMAPRRRCYCGECLLAHRWSVRGCSGLGRPRAGLARPSALDFRRLNLAACRFSRGVVLAKAFDRWLDGSILSAFERNEAAAWTRRMDDVVQKLQHRRRRERLASSWAALLENRAVVLLRRRVLARLLRRTMRRWELWTWRADGAWDSVWPALGPNPMSSFWRSRQVRWRLPPRHTVLQCLTCGPPAGSACLVQHH